MHRFLLYASETLSFAMKSLIASGCFKDALWLSRLSDFLVKFIVDSLLLSFSIGLIYLEAWGAVDLGWCVGCNTAHMAKLPHFPSFFSLFSARANFFDDDSDTLKLVGEPRKVLKSGVLVRTLFSFLEAFCYGEC